MINLEELLYGLKRLNPEVSFELKGDTIVASEMPSKIITPEGVYILGDAIMTGDYTIGQIIFNKEETIEELDEDIDFESNDENLDNNSDENNLEVVIEEEKTEKKHSIRKFVKKTFNKVRYGFGKFFEWFGKRNEIECLEKKDEVEEAKYAEIPEKIKEDNLEEGILTASKEIDELMKSKRNEKIDEVEEIVNEESNEEIKKEELDNQISIVSKEVEKLIENKKVEEIEKEEKINSLDFTDEKIEKEESKQEVKVSNNIRKYTFDSIEATKEKFEEFDRPEKEMAEIKEKIEYYETFLSTHDLSHKDDQTMLNNMKNKLAELKEKYSEYENSRDRNTIIDEDNEKMKYYTQVSMGISEKESELDSQINSKLGEIKTIVPVWNRETFRYDEGNKAELQNEVSLLSKSKEELVSLREECLRRKAVIYEKFAVEGNRILSAARRR